MQQLGEDGHAPRRYGHWIGGLEMGEPSIERRSPAHGGSLAFFAAGTRSDVDAAVKAARSAFAASGWRSKAGAERGQVLNAWANLVEANSERLAIIEAEEVGKPIKYARGEVAHSVALIATPQPWLGRSKAMSSATSGQGRSGSSRGSPVA